MKRCNKKGFTIVELVIVIAVIAILAAVLIPTIAGLVKKANLSADKVAVRNMNTVLATTEIDKDDFSKLINTLADNGFNSNKALIPTSKDHVFYWYGTYNTVILVDENDNVVFPEDEKIANAYKNDKGTNAIRDLANTVAATIDDLRVALAAGGDVYVMDDVVSNAILSISNPDVTNIYLNGHNVSRDASGNTVIYVNAPDAQVNIYGDDNTVITGAYEGVQTLWAAQGTLNIYGGTIIGQSASAFASGTGKVVIHGGLFKCENYVNFTLNILDKDHATASIVVNGGTFINFNPDYNYAEGAGTDFVPDTHKVVYKVVDGQIEYKVIAASENLDGYVETTGEYTLLTDGTYTLAIPAAVDFAQLTSLHAKWSVKN